MDAQESIDTAKITRHRNLSRFWRLVVIVFTIIGLALAINQIFLVRPIIDNGYSYGLIAIFLSLVFIIFPASKSGLRTGVPWYDVLLFVSTLGIAGYFAGKSWDLQHISYVFIAPFSITAPAFILCLLALEGVRRAGGLALFIFTAVFAIYPVTASRMPGLLEGPYLPPLTVVRFHALGLDSLLGLPMQVVGSLVIGFLVFGVIMATTGGGQFFLDLAYSLFGSHRGGPAKVSIFSSGLFGSLSGSVISNVLTTGSVTIPTMKKTGYPPHYAAAVEACASTGGCIMPPVMGAVAFIMAAFLNISYFTVAIAALLPASLYYLGLFMQVDAYAGKVGLKGLQKSEIPPLLSVLKKGWPFVFGLIVLILFLYLRREAQAPFISMVLLMAGAMVRKETRIDYKKLLQIFENIGRVLAEIVGILAACGFIIGAFSVTGVGSSLCRELVSLAGGNAVAMLIFGAISSYILGMGMTVSACYIFLAIILAPGLVALGFNVMAIHLFVLYWGLVSYITPPVALGSYTAAGVAGADPMKTGFTSMRLGIVKYIIPFFFVYSPALIMQGSPQKIIYEFVTAVVGICLLSGGLEGFLCGLGRLSFHYRVLSLLSGFLLAVPDWQTDVIGAGMAIILYTVGKIFAREGSLGLSKD